MYEETVLCGPICTIALFLCVSESAERIEKRERRRRRERREERGKRERGLCEEEGISWRRRKEREEKAGIQTENAKFSQEDFSSLFKIGE